MAHFSVRFTCHTYNCLDCKLLGYIANDLDILLTTLCPEIRVKDRTRKEGHFCPCLSAHVTDFLGTNTYSSSICCERNRHNTHLVHTVSSNHRLVGSNDDGHDSADSDHDARSYDRPSLPVFDKHNCLYHHNQHYSPLTLLVEVENSMDEFRPISTVEKLIKTNSIWLLATMTRTGAVHILKDRETGIFIVRKSSWPNSLALSVQSRKSDHCTVEHYLIEGTSGGFRLQGSAHVFHSIPSLIAYHVENIDEIPYYLKLPSAIQQARSTRELASLDMLGQDFWVSSFSRKSPHSKLMSGALYKSCSEPISIQQPVNARTASYGQLQHEAVSSKSASDIFRTQTDNKPYFQQYSLDPKNLTKNRMNRKCGLVSQTCPQEKVSMNFKNDLNSSTHNTTETTESLQIMSEGYNCSSKKVIDNNDESTVASNLENAHLPLDTNKYKIYLSENPRVMASDSFVLDQPNNYVTSTIGAERSVNTFLSNLKNQSVEKKDGIKLVQQHPKNHDSSLLTSLSSTSQNCIAKDQARTHPGSVPKSKSNLYFTTNLDLLDIQENRYFTSNLSDRLSDYEDIWRSSYCESETSENSTHMTHNSQDGLDVKINSTKKCISEVQLKVLNKIKKDPSLSWHAALADQDTVRGSASGLTALEQARIIAGSTSDDDDESSLPLASVQNIKRRDTMFMHECLPVNNTSLSTSITAKPEVFMNEEQISSIQVPQSSSHEIKWTSSNTLTLNPENDVELLLKNDNSDICAVSSPAVKDSTFQCTFSTTMPIMELKSASNEQSFCTFLNNNNENNNRNHRKPVPSQLGKLSMKSSQASMPSPPYAEPADTVSLRAKNRNAMNIYARRHSAPHSANLTITDRIAKIPQSRSLQNSHLETIFSPDAQSNNNNEQMKFLFDNSDTTVQPKSPFTYVINSQGQSMRTTSDISQFKSWKNKLSRLNLSMEALTHNLTPTKSHGLKKNKITKAANENNQFYNSAAAQTQTELNNTLPGKFPVDHQQDHRTSGFSDSSTVQDLIFCANPELSTLSIPLNLTEPDDEIEKTPSEYDNLEHQAPAPSSFDTVYSSPWEPGKPTKPIRNPPIQSTPKLPPAMDIHERIEQWQQANIMHDITYHDTSFIDEIVNSSDSNILSLNHKQCNMFRPKQHQQLLQHQQQIKDEGNVFKVNRLHSHFSDDSSQQKHHDSCSSGYLQQENKKKKRWSYHETRPVSTSPLSRPTIDTTNSIGLLSSHNRLSWHCPDVVTCHNTSFSTDFSTSSHQAKDVCATNVGISPGYITGEDILLDTDLTQAKQPVAEEILASHSDLKAPGVKIREYIYLLSRDHQTIFGSTIENFIQCTIESQQRNPQVVMRNVRQFMSGIKNYLVKQGKGKLESIIEDETNKLGTNEIMNIDDIIEQALHVCVLKPLKYHIYKLFVEKYSTNGALEQLTRSIKYARIKLAPFIGVKGADMEVIRHYLDRMQKSYSPLRKLQNLLKVTSKLSHCVQGKHNQGPSSLGADDFLPMLIHVIVHCGLVSAEIEADFMWGLLHPSLLSGEGGYCLTTLSSAVLILKDLEGAHNSSPAKMEGTLPTISATQGFLEIAIPDELHDSITWHFLPVRPNMSTKDVCAIIAHRFKVTNPQDYGLFLLCDGLEHPMADTDCPHIIKEDNLVMGISCYFAFKRIDANIAWPKQLKHSTITAAEA